MKRDIESLRKYLDEMTKCFPNSSEMGDLFRGLIGIWCSSRADDLSALFSYERLHEGMYMLDEKRIKNTEFANSAETAVKIITLMKEKRLKDTEALTVLTTGEASEFIRDGLSEEDRYQNFLLKWILRPSFLSLVEKIKIDPSLLEIGKSGRCPVCSSPPGMAIVDTLDNVEQRFLSCCFCRYRWQINLIGCPDCGNSRPEKLSFFVGNTGCEQGARAVSCDECRTYLKTVFIKCRNDGRGFDDLDMDIEDVATIPLDIIASQRGYSPICQGRQKP